MKASNNQCLHDIAALSTGTVASVFEIAAANDVSITSPTLKQYDYTIPTTATTDNKALKTIQNKDIHMGTMEWQGGIGYMQIEINFIVK